MGRRRLCRRTGQRRLSTGCGRLGGRGCAAGRRRAGIRRRVSGRGRPRLALMPWLPPEQAKHQRHQYGRSRDQRPACIGRRLRTGAKAHSGGLRSGRGRRLRAGFVPGHDLGNGQSQQCRVPFQMALDVNRRTNAQVIFGLERIDDPAVQKQIIGRLLRTQAPALALSLEPRPCRCTGIRHRSMPERIIFACSESGNSLCTRRA